MSLTATVKDVLGAARTDQTVRWSSLAPDIASVDGVGLVTGVAAGTAPVVALVGLGGQAHADTAVILVQAATLTLSIAPELAEITLGDSLRLEANFSAPSGADVRGLTVQWRTSDETIAPISGDGLVITLTPGDVTLTATAGGVTATALARVLPNPARSVSIAPANSGLHPGDTVHMTTTIRDARGRIMPKVGVRWSSSDPSVASVNPEGVVRGRSRGAAIITGSTENSVKASATVNIFAVPAAGVVVTAPSNSVTLGGRLQAVATARDAESNVLPGKSVAWSSSNPSVAQVGATGLITGLTVGSTSIHAIIDGKFGTLPISVISANPSAIVIVPATATVSLGKTAQLTAEVRDQAGNVISGPTVLWSSADAGVATVTSNGLVNAVGAGTARISATAGALSAQATIAVIASSVASVSVTPATSQLQIGGTQELNAAVTSSNGSPVSNPAVSWSSSNPSVVTVSALGLATGIGAGNATITATSSGSSGSAIVVVSSPAALPVTSVTVTFNSPSLLLGQSTQATAVARDVNGNIVSGHPVLWLCDDAPLATVSPSGLVTALAGGSATIVARVDGVIGYATLLIGAPTPLPVHTVQLTVSPSTINTGRTAASNVVLRDSLGGTLSGHTIGYSSSKPNVASVGLGGVISGVSAGTAVITASSGGRSGSAPMSVASAALPSVATVSVSANSTSLTPGQVTQATATARDSAGNVIVGQAVTWLSSNPAAASVSGTGLLAGIAAGATTVTATVGGTSGSLVITVSSPTIASVTVSLPASSVAVGQVVQATAMAKDATGAPIAGVTFFWSSSSAATATVSGSGVVVGIAAGTANISASVAGRTGSAPVTVTAAPPQSGVTAVPPAMPTAYVNTTYSPPTGQTIHVPAGGNLQQAIDQAKRGDVITLAPGVTYTGNFILRGNKTGTGYITIRTAAPDASLPPQGTRLTPSRYAAVLPKIQTSAYASVFVTEASTSGYRLLGLEITAASSLTTLNALVQFGEGSSAQNTLAQVARDLILDRSWVHGTATLDLRRCVTLNSAWSAVVDSYLADCHAKGSDSQAIIGWNGPGPFKITNNYLEGAGENVMFGGADPAIPNLNPSDIEVRGNHFYKPVSWKGKWTVKNLFELKQAVRVIVEDNIFENSWVDGQTGFAIVFKSTNQSGGAPWAITSDVTFRYNVVRNASAGLALSANPSANPVVPATRFLFEENIFEGIGNFAGTTNGRMIQLLQGLSDVEIRHNTFMHNAVGGAFILMADPQGGRNLVIRNNIATWGGPWGAVMGTAAQGSQSLAAFANPYAFEGNVVIGMPSYLLGGYPARNSYPNLMSTVGLVNQAGGNYGLIPSSPFKGIATDGRDPGADVTTVRARTQNVIVP